MNIPIYIISLDTHYPDFIKTRNQLKNQGFTNVVMYPAIDGYKLSDDYLKEILTPRTHFYIDDRVDYVNVKINRPAVGCSLSHINLWRDMLKYKTPECIIMEDDADITPDFASKYLEMKNLFPNDFLLLGYSHLVNPITEKKFQRYKGDFWGMHCYLIRNDTARTLLTSVFPIEIPIDLYVGLFSDLNQNFKIQIPNPTISTQREHVSTIQLNKPKTTTYPYINYILVGFIIVMLYVKYKLLKYSMITSEGN